MNLAEFAIKNQVLCVILILLALFGGWNAYQTMARFEEPEFTIRAAKIFTKYPGASPDEVAKEVSAPIETALQQMQEVKKIKTTSSSGLSEITVEIKFAFSKSKNDLQIVWTKLRNKIRDMEHSLPNAAHSPIVNDDFGDLYGLSYFVTGDDYSPAELRRYAKYLQKEILQVEGVAKVLLSGEQKEAIFVEISNENASALGAAIDSLYDILKQQNSVVSAGSVAIADQRLIIDPSGAVDSIDSIKNLLVSTGADGKIIYLKDIAKVYRGYKTPASKIIRYNGKSAIALGVANVPGGNVVVVGASVDKKLHESINHRPLGMEVFEYYHQGKIVEKAVDDFIMNVISALIIVIFSLLLTMGLRSSMVIAFILIITVGATLTTMQIIDVPLHRISLGALIISLGMMVDNAVVITEAILVGIQQGRQKLDISKEIVSQTKWPLLAGTMVGVIAFAPIGFAPGDTAEYTGDLFWVVMLALLFSWLLAMTITPLICYWLFPEKQKIKSREKEGAFFIKYKQLMRWSLRSRWWVITLVVGIFALSIWGARFMTHGFFPQSTTPQMVVDYWLPEGTRIERTAQDMKEIEAFAQTMAGVNAVQTIIGGGSTRYMLTYSPESANSSYGQLLVRVDDYHAIDSMMPIISEFIEQKFPEAHSKTWRFVLGPGGGAAIEAEFKGPDPQVLRRLANKAKTIMVADGGALSIKDNWRQPVGVITPIYSEAKARRAGVSRQDLADAILRYYSGKQVGVYREGEDLIPIISRLPNTENATIHGIKSIQILSGLTGKTVPIAQVTDGFKTIWRDGQIRSENRIFEIKAQSDPYPNELAASLLKRIRPQIEAIELPNGYSMEWGGEGGDSQKSNNNLMSTIPLGFLAMVLVVVISFGSILQPLIIWLVVPLATIGVVFGLVVTGIPLEFMGILGLLSLSGLLIQNGIILVDRMDTEIKEGKPRFDAIIDSAASRVRPVVLGSFTTALGVIPLFFDAFFQSMAVVLVFGLTFATLLTLLIVPVLYATFLNVKTQESQYKA
ncbi:MAG: efflux RND transporter permease subunit [Candidatus Endonucleobacter sp. (ex Gigantidas childressi)]|nr:efflux RND transporter permease subunit [Candidatus Endonucleobacter sp. (ex Gigantidas childressi)]